MDNKYFIKQLDIVIDEFKTLASKSAHNDLSDLPKAERQAAVTKAVAAIQRISGPHSTYSRDTERLRKDMPHLHLHMTSVMGVAEALRSDMKNGFVESLAEVAHADIFADFLEMAQHLLDSNYKDASAVIAGSSLEAHLRALCQKNTIDTEITKAGGEKVAKKADTMNSELASADVYGKLDQKSITAWLDLRNKAAHGKYMDYEASHVSNLVAGVRDFIRRNPA